MISQGTSFWLLLLPFLLSQGVLVVLLLLNNHQNGKIQKGLIDRLLMKEGLEPLPAIKPMDDLMGTNPDDTKEQIEQAIQALRRKKASGHDNLRFKIPGGMPHAGMGS